MAAGLGFKDFQTGEVLTAADVDGYLMQGIWVFDDAAARDAAVTSPEEGNFAFLKDTNVTTFYDGAAWVNVDTTGMTNPMTTTADIIYSSSGSTPARLGIGTVGQVLTVNSGATAPEWATPSSGGGMTLINSGGTTLTGASVTISSIPTTYQDLRIVIQNPKPANDGVSIAINLNGDTAANRHTWHANTNGSNQTFDSTNFDITRYGDNSVANGLSIVTIYDYANTTTWKLAGVRTLINNETTTTNFNYLTSSAFYNQTSAITSLRFAAQSGNMTSGTVYVYGVK